MRGRKSDLPAPFASAKRFQCPRLQLPGTMGLFAVVSVYLLYRLGARLFDRATGLLAAAIMAFSPVHVSWSQVIRSDIMATTFMLAAMLASLGYLRTSSRRHFLLAGVLAGLAIATKWPFGVALLAPLAAIGGILLQGVIAPRAAVSRAAVVSGLALLTLLLVSPYLVLDFETALSNLRGEAQVNHVGSNGFGFFGNLWFYLREPLLAALGPVVLAAALAGLFPRQSLKEFALIVGVPTVTLLLIMCLQNLVWERWALPLIPALALSASHAGMQLLRKARQAAVPPAVLALAALLAVVLAAWPVMNTLSSRHAERIVDNRRLATDWARENLPEGSVVMVEHFAWDLQDSSLQVLFPVGTGGCFDARALLQEQVGLDFVNGLRGGNSNLDYAAVPAAQRATCAADYAIVTEAGRYFAEAELYPEEVAAYRELMGRGQIIKSFTSIPGEVGGREQVLIIAL